MPKNKSINLLPQAEFDVSLVGRALKWAMGTFRIIVIVTEMVVMAAFLSRFWLDAQNADLTNSIKIKTAQIKALADTEKTFRALQKKLDIFKKIEAAAPLSQGIDQVLSKVPVGVNVTSITVLSDSIQIKGSSVSEMGIAQFMANLKADQSFKSVDLGQISSSESNIAQTIFIIKIKY